MGFFNALRRTFGNVDRSTQLLAEIREGIANMTDVLNRSSLAQQQAQADAARTALRSEQTLAEIRQALRQLSDAMGSSSSGAEQPGVPEALAQPAESAVPARAIRPFAPQAFRQVRSPVVEVARDVATAPSPRLSGR
jgi:ElaB/YqjD/DUF883 family membrane-anchored ribosome-binding protein